MVENFPRNLGELEHRFASNEQCRDYLALLRWPAGWACPRCQNRESWSLGRGLYRCRQCRYEVSVTVWFRAMWLVTSQKNGASALGLQRVLGLGSYRTAWALLHKLRRAMVRPGRDRLTGTVEVDETYWGGPEKGLRGRLIQDKALIAMAAQEDGVGLGRIRLARIPDVTQATLHRFIAQVVEPGAVVRTDGLSGYLGLVDYRHERRIQGPDLKVASQLLPRVHLVASLLKRWLLGTHQGALGQDYLEYYLDEFTFRFNRRKSSSRGKLFYRLVQQAAQVPPATLHALTHHHR